MNRALRGALFCCIRAACSNASGAGYSARELRVQRSVANPVSDELGEAEGYAEGDADEPQDGAVPTGGPAEAESDREEGKDGGSKRCPPVTHEAIRDEDAHETTYEDGILGAFGRPVALGADVLVETAAQAHADERDNDGPPDANGDVSAQLTLFTSQRNTPT